MSRSNNLVTERSIAALIITYNEELNIYRTLSSISWIPDVLVIDSGSSDQTLDIICQFKNTRVIHRSFDSFARQCNFGLNQLSSDWVLSLDADYVLSPQLSDELFTLLSNEDLSSSELDAYCIGFSYCIHGTPIRSGLLPPRTCFYKRRCAQYIDIGHGHRVIINGRVGKLRNKIFHDDRKPFSKWLENQQRYQKLEAKMLKVKSPIGLPIQDLIRKYTFMAPFSAFFMCLILRGGLFDGREGVIYAFHRCVAESLLYLYMHMKADE